MSLRLLWITVTLLLGAVAPADILVLLPHPGKSHFMVFEPLLHELSRRGHNLTVLSFFPSASPRRNYRDISLVGLVDVHVATVDMANFAPMYGLERLLYHYIDMERLAKYALHICEKLMTWPAAQEVLDGSGNYNLVLLESFNSDCMLGAATARYRAPVVGLSSHQLLPWVVDRLGVPFNTAHLPLLVLPLGQNMNLWQRFENTLFTQFYKYWFRRRIQMREAEILRRRLGRELVADLADTAANMNMILVNTHHSLNGVWPLPPGVIEVGGLHVKPSDQPMSADLKSRLESSSAGAVIVSFGSLLNSSTMPTARVQAMLAAFSRLPQTFMWKWELDAWPTPKPSNVFFYKWLPQQALLGKYRSLIGMQASKSVGLICALACACVWPYHGCVHASRILALFPHPGRSHQMVFEPLFRRLAERGHDVTVVSFFPVEDPPPTYRDVSLVGLNEIHLAMVDMANFEVDWWGFERFIGQAIGLNMLADFATSICQKFLEWPTVQELVRANDTYDVILVENFNSDCMLGFAYRYNAPFVALLSHNFMTWSSDRLGVPDNPSYVPAMGTHFTDKMTLLERLENCLFLYYFKMWFRFAIQTKEQSILEQHFGHQIVDISEVARNYSLMLINTHHSLNGVRPLVPGVVEVGGMHLEGPRQHIPPSVDIFLKESEYGVVLFSFGSLIKSDTMPKRRLETFLKVFNRLSQRVIWKWEANMEEKHHNIMTLKWIPQYELLLHPKVVAFIAHGGLLGMTEAVDAGVPMLVIPFFGDQPGNAAAAEQAGLATVLPYNQLNEENLYAALQKVLSPEMRESAARVSRVWRDRPAPPLATAVYWVERTARLGHTQRLASHARTLPAYQLALLDVAALTAAILATLLLLIYILVRALVRLIKPMNLSKVKSN